MGDVIDIGRPRRRYFEVYGQCEAVTTKGRRCMNTAQMLDVPDPLPRGDGTIYGAVVAAVEALGATFARRDGHVVCAVHNRAATIRGWWREKVFFTEERDEEG